MQRIEDFLDEDELEERRATTLKTRAEYDTFGSGAKMEALKAAEMEAAGSRIIPGPVPDMLIAPAKESLGTMLYLLSSILYRFGGNQNRRKYM